MEKNLLQKEEEFHKLNAELELKTKELLKEVEGVMKIQDRSSKNEISACTKLQNPTSSSFNNISKVHTSSLNESRRRPNVKPKIISCASQNQSSKYGRESSVRTELPPLNMQVDSVSSLYMSSHGGIGDEVLPEASHGMGTENLTRVLRAKIKGLQNEMEALQVDYKKRTEAWRKLQMEMKKLEEDRNKWQQQTGTLRDSLKKQELQASSTTARLTQQESENVSLKKELDTLKKELRSALQTSKANEVRLNRSLEELEKLRTILQNHKRDDKELRDLMCKKGDEVAVVVKRLEKQKSELLHGFKKQMQLIDNLKNQKAHLQAACMMKFCEDEFLKLLDWSPDKHQSEQT